MEITKELVEKVNKELRNLKVPHEVRFRGMIFEDGEWMVKMDLPRWYRHPNEYGNIEESDRYNDVACFEDKVYSILMQNGLSNVTICA